MTSSHAVKRRTGLIMVAIAAAVIVLCGLFFVGYAYGTHVKSSLEPVQVHIERVKTWLTPSQANGGQKASKTRSLIEQEKPVHFEFYSTLPEMAVNAPVISTNDNLKRKAVRVAKNTAPIASPFASSRDELVKELADKLDDAD
jgi:hypothetical protein